MSITQDVVTDKSRTEHNAKKRKPEPTKDEQSSGSRKKIKKEGSKAAQKRVDIESDSDAGEQSPKLEKKSSKARKPLLSASESDAEGPNPPPDSPKVGEANGLNNMALLIHSLGSHKDLGKASRPIPAATVAEVRRSYVLCLIHNC
jgi:hypothetical protein